MKQSLLQKQTLYSYDCYLDNHLHYGRGQAKLALPIYLLLFAEGSQSIVLGLLLPIIANYWLLTSFQQSLLITIVYLGVTLGSAIQMKSDTSGRKPMLIISSSIQASMGLISVVVPYFSMFLVVRFIYGISLGITFPLAGTYLSEISPGKQRATHLMLGFTYWSIGGLVTCLITWCNVTQMNEGNWRLILFLSALPGVLAFILVLSYSMQSPRYLLLKGYYIKAKQIMSQLQADNQKPILEPGKFEELIIWSKNQEQFQKNMSSFNDLLSQRYKLKTLRLFFCWISTCFIFYSLVLLTPTLFHNLYLNKNLSYITLICFSFVQMLGYIISKYLADNPHIGRNKTIRYSYILILGLSVIMLVNSNSYLLCLILTFQRFCVSIAFLALYPYTTQLYHTLIRSKAMGISSILGRAATILVGIMGLYLITNGSIGLSISFIFLSGMSIKVINDIKQQTVCEQLDKI